ncbi:hypothetical protein NHH03_21815 [Stieleria sp. TO1_6]|uniref:hypothetical protein n=1 Tax=Stieleria tagensis TaxID=2956795 RepID=UPI00209B8CFD|nr:hypothetical protein [Stieleria tagensis]MCO8124392.1 hypothetical protein [Stieleria tagensis]
MPASTAWDAPDPQQRILYTRYFFGALLAAWLIALCVVPDPRPLGAPQHCVHLMQRALGLSEPTARMAATLTLRSIGFATIGIFAALTLTSVPMRWSAPGVLVAAPLLAVLCQSINHGYFPVYVQLQLSIGSAILGALAGLALRKSVVAAGGLALLAIGLLFWGTSTGISDDLAEATRATAMHVLAESEQIPDGDPGFLELLQTAFEYAEDNSHGTDAVFPNQAAILALGVILGEERVAEVAKRPINLSHLDDFKAFRNRITLHDRNDLARHFWVSAALATLADQRRSFSVGIGKELMDATPGGSGFSFVDLTADRAGTLFAELATGSATSARLLQQRIQQGIQIIDICPDIDGLPEGLTGDAFETDFGGLGGAKTKQIEQEIRRRLATCRVIAPLP